MSQKIDTQTDISFFEIKDIWFAKMLNREIAENSEKYYNTEVYTNSTSEWYDPSVRITVSTTNQHISGMECEKYTTKEYGHGKSFSSECSLNIADRNRAIRFFEEYSICRVTEDSIKELINKALESHSVGISKKGKNYIFTIKNSEIQISIKTIIEYLEIAYSYPDIIDNYDFWRANSNYLKLEYYDAISFLFSFFDINSIYDSKAILEAAEKRKYKATASLKYFSLCKAIKSGNLKQTNELLVYAKESFGGEHENAVYEAILKGDRNLIKSLIDANAYVNNACIKYAIRKKDSELFYLLLTDNNGLKNTYGVTYYAVEHKQFDFLIPLIKKGAFHTVKGNEGDKILTELLLFKNVDWNIDSIIVLIQNCHYSIAKEVLNNNPDLTWEVAYELLCNQKCDLINSAIDNVFYDNSLPFLYQSLNEENMDSIIHHILLHYAPDYRLFKQSQFETVVEKISLYGSTENVELLINQYPEIFDFFKPASTLLENLNKTNRFNIINGDLLNRCEKLYQSEIRKRMNPKLEYSYLSCLYFIPDKFSAAKTEYIGFLKKCSLELHDDVDDYSWSEKAKSIISSIEECNIHIDAELAEEIRYLMTHLLKIKEHKSLKYLYAWEWDSEDCFLRRCKNILAVYESNN